MARELEPGRELDALVAEKVMGYVRHRTPDKCDVLLPPGFEPATWRTAIGGRLHLTSYVPPYSTSLLHAWRVLERFGGEISVQQGGGACLAGLGSGRVGAVQFATGESAPHAICLAALRHKGVAC